ncbi:porin [Rhodobacteraceae bacterium N5(2021)]|uniref:Porin n=1 Tax=Gymnodinialimonas phycosphaerae TaxID=2841589 RepID=A0A975TVM5_9RHOB|nr:porin [Gymnodinialimonas phycosphaerae]MBY4894989.1 porin [Gymnodinialimonas phycosphaerae]
MIRPAIFVGVLAALPSVSLAQGITFDGAATLGYSFTTVNDLGTDISLNGASLDFDGDLGFSDEFSVGLGFSFGSSNLEVTGLPNDINIDLLSLSIEPEYRFSNGAYVGAYYRMGDLDVALVGPLTIGLDTSQYGIFGGYDFGQGHVEVFYGQSQFTDNALLGALGNTDVTDYGISASYQAMPELDIFGSVLRTDVDLGGTDLHFTAFSIGAEYDVTPELAVYGSVGQTIIDLSALGAPDDITATGLTIGASYDLTSAASIPMYVSAEYSHTNLDLSVLGLTTDPTVDRFAVGLTIPIGNGSGAALNSNTRTARGEYRSAVAAVFNSF